MNKEELKEYCKLSSEQICKQDYELRKLQQENKKYNELIEYINRYESIKAYYEYIDEDGYDEYNYDEDFKKELLDILKEVK